MSAMSKDTDVVASVLTFLLKEIHALPSALVYGLVALLVFGEAALFVGFVLPGETTVIVAGVVASQGRVNFTALMILVVSCAILGDSVGYAVGAKFGGRLLELRLLRRHREELDKAMLSMARRGPIYVFFGRFTAFLRAVMPGLAGISRMAYRRFLIANALSGLLWGVAFTTLGYEAGHQLPRIERYSNFASYGILAVVVIVALSLHFWRRWRRTDTTES